jgi:hypothetical protein
MRIIAPMMILIMMTSTLAGCTGGDPDGGGNDEIDMDILNQLIDDNLQDFINNTTITVENHYHNNTTIVNNDYSQTNFSDSSSATYSGNYSISGVQLIDLRFSLNDLMNIDEIDFRNNTFEHNYTYYDYLTNENRQDTFSMSCNNFYLVGSGNSSSGEIPYWVDNSGYYSAWDTIYNNTIRDLLENIANDDWLREICDENYFDGQDYYNNLILHEIVVPEGMAFSCTHTQSGYPMLEEFYWNEYTSLWDDYNNRGANGQILYPDGGLFDWYGDPFNIGMDYLSTPWSCSEGFAGGSEDTIISISVDRIVANIEYRLQLYYQFIPINFVSNNSE